MKIILFTEFKEGKVCSVLFRLQKYSRSWSVARSGHAPATTMERKGSECGKPCALLENPEPAGHPSGVLELLERGAVHVCHVCTTCHDRSNGPKEVSAPDIAGISAVNSGAIIFHMLYSALTEPGVGGWKESEEAVVGDSTARAIDAGQDERLKPHFLYLVSDSKIKLKISPVRCLSLCGAPHVIALRGGLNKFAYQFGGINREEMAGLVHMITSFCTSTDGYSSTRTRAESLRGRISARIPPLNGRVVGV